MEGLKLKDSSNHQLEEKRGGNGITQAAISLNFCVSNSVEGGGSTIGESRRGGGKEKGKKSFAFPRETLGGERKGGRGQRKREKIGNHHSFLVREEGGTLITAVEKKSLKKKVVLSQPNEARDRRGERVNLQHKSYFLVSFIL